jgi:hypothetical protein
VITLEFELTQSELDEFQATIGSRLNGHLPIAITFGDAGFESIAVLKQGRGGPTLTRKSAAIATFVAERLRFEHIPAVRTAEAAQNVVEGLLEEELRHLENDQGYLDAVNVIAGLQEPILQELSNRICDTLRPFLNGLVGVRVQISDTRRFEALRRSCEIFLDDGAHTLLEHKGDGVQSLAALALMRDVSRYTSGVEHTVIAVEEPESHLHSGAIHELRRLLASMSKDNQIIVTTHNPLFVDRAKLDCNVIVRNKIAGPAASLAALREALGVRASDNLQHASLVLVVEGPSDATAMSALLSEASQELKGAIQDGRFHVEPLRGGANLGYFLGQLRAAICPFHVLLDNDDSGRKSADECRESGLLSDSEVSFVTMLGRAQSELEDWINPAMYVDAVMDRYNVTLSGPRFKGTTKWSRRAGETFRSQNQPWDDRQKAGVKALIADLVSVAPEGALLPPARDSLAVLAETLKRRLRQSEST